jgi:hypothetical protein
MKKLIYILVLITVVVFSSCTFHIPYESYESYRSVRVKLHVEPDDAQVLVNGRFVGAAYEFVSSDTALRLRSRNSEIIIKKEGYIEEVVDLHDYSTRDITVTLTLRKDNSYVRETRMEKKVAPLKPTPEIAAERDLAGEPDEVDIENFKLINIILDIVPAEASIYLDGKFWGIAPANGKIENLKLKTGKYTLEIVKPGYKAYKKTLDLAGQKEIKLSIKLQK